MKKESQDYSSLINGMRGGHAAMLLGVLGIGNTKLDVADLVEDLMRDASKESIKAKVNEHKNDLTYSLDELFKIEKVIDERYPAGHKPLYTTMIPFGFYLGELMVTTIAGAEWVTDAASISDIAVKLRMPSGEYSYWKPFMRVQMYWKNREDRMSTFYKMCEFLSEIEFSKEYLESRMDADGWIYMESGDAFRMRTKDKSEIDLTKWPGKL